MIKLIRSKLRSCHYSLLIPAVCLYIVSENASAVTASATLNGGVPNVNYTMQVDKLFTGTVGSLAEQTEFSSPSGAMNWRFPNKTNTLNIFGPQVFKVDFTSAVDTSSTTTYGGIKYYKVSTDVGSNIPLYVAIRQGIYDNTADAMSYYFVPYLEHNNSVTEIQTMSSYSDCVNTWNNTEDLYTCSLTIDINQRGSVSGRNGTIYFYMPKIPTNDITFTGIEIAKGKIHSAYSTDSWSAARDYSKSVVGSQGYDYFHFFLSGTLRMDQSCQISNGPVVLEVPLGNIVSSTFTTKGGKPSGYTPKPTILTFSCKRDIGDTYGAMKWSISPTSASSGSGLDGVLVAKPSNGNTIDGVGVKITSDSSGNTPVKLGGDNLQGAEVIGNKAMATFYAYPTMTTDTKPSGGGDFSATATVTFEVP